ncbi:hypothetical protein T459_01631 [Capsicum annuum]|uniref:Uncharacterized protein n=1 Tax=Capsicum annuum TaxID=4072 RepID=A0A2G3AHP0_CAPAN|nr:hypothetical protein FXO37_08807 [Capsicum annuum]PHT93749.1 hypothetical protein T459_01631 [Capsicum annuum]
MFRDRAMSHYQEHSLFGGSHRLHGCINGLGFDRQTGMDRGVGVTIGRRAASFFSERLKLKELESEPLLDANGLKSLIRLLRLAQKDPGLPEMKSHQDDSAAGSAIPASDANRSPNIRDIFLQLP